MHLLYGFVKEKALNLQCHFAQYPLTATDLNLRALADEQLLGFVIVRRELLPLARKLHSLGQRFVVVGRPPDG